MIQFQGFKPSGMEKIANAMGFQGEEKDFKKFLEDNPDRQAEMIRYQNLARKMVEGQCPVEYTCKYDPFGKEPNIDSVVDSLNDKFKR